MENKKSSKLRLNGQRALSTTTKAARNNKEAKAVAPLPESKDAVHARTTRKGSIQSHAWEQCNSNNNSGSGSSIESLPTALTARKKQNLDKTSHKSYSDSSLEVRPKSNDHSYFLRSKSKSNRTKGESKEEKKPSADSTNGGGIKKKQKVQLKASQFSTAMTRDWKKEGGRPKSQGKMGVKGQALRSDGVHLLEKGTKSLSLTEKKSKKKVVTKPSTTRKPASPMSKLLTAAHSNLQQNRTLHGQLVARVKDSLSSGGRTSSPLQLPGSSKKGSKLVVPSSLSSPPQKRRMFTSGKHPPSASTSSASATASFPPTTSVHYRNSTSKHTPLPVAAGTSAKSKSTKSKHTATGSRPAARATFGPRAVGCSDGHGSSSPEPVSCSVAPARRKTTSKGDSSQTLGPSDEEMPPLVSPSGSSCSSNSSMPSLKEDQDSASNDSDLSGPGCRPHGASGGGKRKKSASSSGEGTHSGSETEMPMLIRLISGHESDDLADDESCDSYDSEYTEEESNNMDDDDLLYRAAAEEFDFLNDSVELIPPLMRMAIVPPNPDQFDNPLEFHFFTSMHQDMRTMMESIFENAILQFLAAHPELQGDQAPPALSQEKIDTLPQVHVEQSFVDQDQSCIICCCEYKLNDLVTKLPCKHLFHHTPCITAWLLKSGTCPICRFVLNNNEDGNDNEDLSH